MYCTAKKKVRPRRSRSGWRDRHGRTEGEWTPSVQFRVTPQSGVSGSRPVAFYRQRSNCRSRRSLDGAYRWRRGRDRAHRGSRRRATGDRCIAWRAGGRTRRGTARLARRSANRVGTRLFAVKQRARLATRHRRRQDQYRRQGEELTHDSFPPKPTHRGLR